jgi:hypothetical protein
MQRPIYLAIQSSSPVVSGSRPPVLTLILPSFRVPVLIVLGPCPSHEPCPNRKKSHLPPRLAPPSRRHPIQACSRFQVLIHTPP